MSGMTGAVPIPSLRTVIRCCGTARRPGFRPFSPGVPEHVFLGLRDVEIERRLVHILRPVGP